MRSAALTALCALATWLATAPAQARRLYRARFEVDTLEVEKPGFFAFDAQLGAAYGDGDDGSRLIVPDFELDVGITKWLELDIDSGYHYRKLGQESREWVGAPIWTALRFDLYSVKDDATGRTFGVGAQIGPRLPNLRNVGGVGAAGLVLVGGGNKSINVVGNFGLTADKQQALAFNYGVGLAYTLDEASKLAVVGQIAGAYYFQRDADQLLVLAGVQRSLNEDLEIQILLLTGPIYDGDRIGVLIGTTYRNGLW